MNNPESLPLYHEFCEKDLNKLYVIICKGGKTKVAFLEVLTDYSETPEKKYVRWNTLDGTFKNVMVHEVVAYKPLDIPQEIIDLVKSNPQSKNSKFIQFYG